MKKLIAMIGAVATAFGLYATDLVQSGISFEADDAGSSGATLDVDAGDDTKEGAVLWSTDAEDAPKIKAYADEAAPIAAYTGYGDGKARRSAWFANGSTSDKYLSLSTGTNSLTRLFANRGATPPVDGSEALFIDTLVRFTGFEEDPVITEDGDEKVVIWLKAIEDDPDTEEDEGTTNLYITCGRSYDSGDKLVTLEITNKGYAPEQWYRLTIKSIGNIFKQGTESRLGFLVYIDGEQIACTDATDLVQATDDMTQKAAEYQRLGQLFPSIKTGLELKGAGFQGMGQIDDLIVSKADANGTPDFANEINFTVTATGAKVLAVTNSVTGAEVKFLDGVYTVKPGEKVDVYFGADGPWVLTPPIKKVPEVTVNTTEIDLSSQVDAKPAAAQINGEPPVYFETAAEAFAAAQPGDTIKILKDQTSYAPQGVEGEDFQFVLGTEIFIDDLNGKDWTVSFPEDAEDPTLTDNYGVDAGQTITVFGNLFLTASIPATGSIDVWGQTELFNDIDLAGELKTYTLMNSYEEEDDQSQMQTVYRKMTLGVNGAYQQTDQIETLANFFGNEDLAKIVETPVKESEEEEEPSAYRYTLKGGVEFTIKAPDNAEITNVSGAEPVAGKEGTYTAEDGAEVTVTLKADEGYLFENKTDTTTEIFEAADGEITLQTAPTKAAAKKGGMFFITLQDAIDDSAEGDITLLADVALDAAVTLAKDETINLGGFTLSSTVASGYAFRAGNNALVLSNGTFTSTFRGVEVVNGSVTFGDGLTATTAKRTAQVLDGTGTITVAEGATVGSTDTNSGEPTLMAWLKVASDYEGDPASIVVNGTVDAAGKGVAMYGYGDLLVTEGAVVQTSGNASAVDMRSIYDDNAKQPVALIQGTLECTSSTDNGENVCFTTFGTDNVIGVNATIDTTAVLVSHNGLAIYFPSAGSLTVKGTVTGANGIWVKGGATAVIDGARVTATATDVVAYDPENVNHNGCPSCGNAIAFSQEAGYAGVSPNTTITGGIFTSAAGAAIASYAETGYERLTGFVTGGKFKGAVAPATDLIAVGPGKIAKWTTDKDGYLVPDYDLIMIAKNLTSNLEYADLKTAFAEAEDGETIQFIVNGEFEFDRNSIATVASKAITLDLNGKKLTGKAYPEYNAKGDPLEQRMISVAADGELTVVDSTVAEGGYGAGELHFEYINSGTPLYSAGYYLILKNGKLTVKSGKLTANDNIDVATYGEGSLVYAIENRSNGNSAELVIEGGYICVPDHKGQCAVRLYAYDNATPTYVNKATITGGILDNVYPLCMTVPDKGAKFDVNISGGTFNGYCRLKGDNYGYSRVNITGGIFNGNAEGFDIQDDNKERENLPWLFISGGTFEQYEYLSKYIGPTKDNTLIVGGTFNKVGKAEENPQNIEELLTPSIPVYAGKKDAETDGFFTVELIPVALDIDAGEGVTDFTYMVNDEEPVDGQQVKFGDVIKITDVTYAAGYKPGEITKDTEITVGEELLVDEDGELVKAVVVTVDAAKCFGGGSGVIDDPYIIETYDHLVELQAWVADGKETAGVYFKQTADIDFAGKDPWTGIGDQYTLTNPKAFEGSYDGNNCKISNVIFGGVADSSGKCKYNGFFNFTKNASFANLTIDVAGLDPNVTVAFGAAAFVGYAKGDTISFENCVADGTISGTHNVAGFMVGGEVAGTFLNCTNKATIATTDDRAAGFVNINTRNDGVIFTYTNCKNEGVVSAQATGGTACGFHGYVTATKTHTIQFTNCENTGTLAATYVGSFAGVLHVGTLANMGGNVAQAEYPVYGMSDSTADKYATVGFTYGKVEAGKATYIATLVKDTEYDQFSNDASETIFTLAAKDDWIAFKEADGITAPTAEQIAVADDSIKVEVDEDYTDGIKFVAVAAQTEPIPPLVNPTQGDIEKVFATAQDQTLKTKVTSANYDAFRTWSRSLDEDAAKSEAAVLATPDAFLCFAVNSTTLPTAGEITSEDVKIEAYNKDTGVIEVAIEGVTPGQNVPAGELAKVLTAVGGSTLDGMTADKVNVSGQCVEAGKIQVTVTPKDTTATAFFIKAELVK